MMPTRLARFFGRLKGDAARFLGTAGTDSSESESELSESPELSESELSESDSLSDSYLSMWLVSAIICLMASPLLRALWNVPEHLIYI